MAKIVPLSNAPNQTITVTLNINGGSTTLNIFQYWNRIGQFWAIDIFNAFGTPLVTSVPLVTGDWPGANILSAFEYLQIGEWFIINQSGATTDIPTDQNLGTGFALLVDDNVGSGSSPGVASLPQVAGSGNWSSYPVAALSTVLAQ